MFNGGSSLARRAFHAVRTQRRVLNQINHLSASFHHTNRCRSMHHSTTNLAPSSPAQPSLVHDVGGHNTLYNSEIPPDKSLQPWEQQCHALFAVLASKKFLKTDQLRRAIENITPNQYDAWSYYEKWTGAMTSLLLDQGTITHSELHSALFGPSGESRDNQEARFQPGDPVRVRAYQPNLQWRRPHIRTPGYIYGVCGTVQDVCGQHDDPSFLAFGLEAPKSWLYRVGVSMADLWPEQSSSKDVLSVELYEHWLEPSSRKSGHGFEHVELLNHDADGRDCVDHDSQAHSHNHSHHHHHHGDEEDHSHDPRPSLEQRAVHLEDPPRPGQDLLAALRQILLQKQIVTTDELRTMVEGLENAGTQLHGATLVVRAWQDADFQKRLLENPAEAALEIGIHTSNPNAPTVLSIVANTPEEHNLVVCTLCSCYPSGLLGIAPSWYKSREYRARAVREPRSVLEEFGNVLEECQRVKVHDSTADHRYLVLPMRPEGTEGWDEDQLRELVTRDSMIGVTVPKA